MRRCLIIAARLALALPLAACAAGPAPRSPPTPPPSATAAPTATAAPLGERLNGAWDGPMLMVFDVARGRYESIVLFETDSGSLTIVSEDASTIVCELDGKRTTIEFLDPDTIRLTAEEASPMVLTRQLSAAPGESYPYPYPPP